MNVVYGEEEKPDLLIYIELKINYAYEMIVNAEEEGADVRDLAKELNDANNFLIKTKILLLEGNLTEASITAQECRRISTQIAEEAKSLATSAVHQASLQTRNKHLSSYATIIGIIIASIFSWRTFRKFYLNRALNLKPEVLRNET